MNAKITKIMVGILFLCLNSCGPSAEQYVATFVAETAVAARSTPLPTETPVSALLVPESYPSIQMAIDSAEDGDVIVVSSGRYSESIDFLGKNITLRSTNPDDPDVVAATIIIGDGGGSVVTFQSGETSEAKLEGFTITDGNSLKGGGLAIFDSSPTITNNMITGNRANSGGGILIENSKAFISNNIINGNLAQGGGGILIENSSPTITGNIISDNLAELIGGGIAGTESISPNITISQNTISSNQAGLLGGGIFLGNSSPLISDNIITGNNAQLGGGIAMTNNSAPSLLGNSVEGNHADTGSAIYLDNSSPIISNTIVGRNHSELGGGILVGNNSSPTISGSTFVDNVANSNGGAIWVSSNSSLILNVPDDNIYSGNSPDDIYYAPE